MSDDNETPIHICLCFDGNINRQVLLTATSAAASTQRELTVHFLCPQSASQLFKIDLNALLLRLHYRRAKRFTPEIHVVPDEEYEKLPSINWLPKASCLRLLISSYLPKGLQRIIYLDSDIMVTADLGDLFHTHMHGHPIAAVQDAGMRQIYCDPAGLNARHYFNAGVLLIDLAQWDVPAKRALALFAEKGATYSCLDQDVLNIVFKDNWLELDARWNLTEQRQPFASRWFELMWPDGRDNEEIPPSVYHMTPFKPWCRCCTSRYRFTYRRMALDLFGKTMPIDEEAPFMIWMISWFPRPLYRLMRFFWDTSLFIRFFFRISQR